MGIITLNNKIILSGNKMALYNPPPFLGKSTIITMNLDGTDRQYRVLKIEGTMAEVLAMWNLSTNQTFCADEDNEVNIYSGSALDIYLNTTWYNTLSVEAKNAIVPKTITQDSWYWGTSGNPQYSGTYGASVPGDLNYTISKDSDNYTSIGDRYAYAISVQEVLDYLSDSSVLVDTSAMLRNVNIWKMFWNTETQPSNYLSFWFRSALTSTSNSKKSVYFVDGKTGNLNALGAYYLHFAARAAFQIDLSKIHYTINS